MTKKAFEKIAEGLNDAIAFARGEAKPNTFRVHVPEEVDVRSIRKTMGMTQEAFAARYGFYTGTVRDWEQKRRRPEASARLLLKMIEKRPDVVEEVLRA